ncbi:hypothetical protein JXM67_04025 [candidate division WOR-3 bacterium]|nr:hypothetical protein [candidate division WOR-3 bacterium]
MTHLLRTSLLLCITLGSANAVTREEILARAESFAGLTWYADSANTTAWDSMFARYGCADHQTSDWEPGNTYQGMAYSYGGNDDTVTYIQKLEDGLAAGNHMCHYQNYGAATGIYPPDWTTGIDCSAFVCRCWGVPRTNTGGILDNYYAVAKPDVLPGDALVKPGSHVILIADPGETPGSGTFALYEASGSACRVWYNPQALWSAYGGYSARSLFNPGVDEDELGEPNMQIISESFLAREGVLLRLMNPGDIEELSFSIFNSSGRRIYTGEVTGPEFTFSWGGIDDAGFRLPSGVYYVRSTETSSTARVILIR